jgi:15-cis-phytoene synthase
VRPHLLALYAFNIELARIRDAVSEPALGEIRLQWWLDAIASTYLGDAPGHPVLEALAGAIEQGSLPKASFLDMIEARRFDLYDDPMPTTGDLEGYLGETQAALIQMSALVIDRTGAQVTAEVAGLAGVAMGVASLLRSLPRDRARGQCYVPAALLREHGLTPADLTNPHPPDGLAAPLRELRELARKRLEEACAKQEIIVPELWPAFLPAALTRLYLDRLDTLGPASLERVAEVSQLHRQWHLYWSARRRVF